MRSPLAVRRFTTADQEWFGALTGDVNPLHLDPLAARRELFGGPVVHGMHAAAWGLEGYLADRRRAAGEVPAVTTIRASFARPIFLDEPVELVVPAGDAGTVTLALHAGGSSVTDIRLGLAARAPAPLEDCPPGAPAFGGPRVGDLDELEGRSGTMAVSCDRAALEQGFPAACALLGAGRLAGWLMLSSLVGMECPGRDALFSALDMTLRDGDDAERLHYAVDRADRRFSMVRLAVGGCGLEGTVTAFVRPPPAGQPSMVEIAEQVPPGAWAGQRALVVGGSRGLGEVTAKLVAAGGGEPAITYRTGADDAERVAGEIREWGGACEQVELDVADPGGTLEALSALSARGWSPTHVYYFATPRIFVRKSRLFDPALFRTFAAVYVDGFLAVHDACRAVTDGPLRLFYPSSVAVDDDVRELTEYAAAKAAGESLCRSLNRFAPDSSVTVERLPRVATDQTLTLLPVPAADAVSVMRGIVEAL